MISGRLAMMVSLVALTPAAQASDVAPEAVLVTYADIAEAVYGDALATARELDSAIATFIEQPGPDTHETAKAAWLAARVPYQQSEAYRFGNLIVDEWEGKVNAWPLDEGLIDYVATDAYGEESDQNRYYTANVIAHPQLEVGGGTLDAAVIDKDLIRSLHEIDEVESNVATGYHAIEFLLWGQDLNGTGPGAGDRPWTDYAQGDACTHGPCDRRADYLASASALLLDDLAEMAAAWDEGGEAREALLSAGPEQGLETILTGLGSLSYGELAGERMKLGLMLHDPEEEHDCFSDNTHNSHYYDAKGIQNVYLGRYERVDGTVVEGPSLHDVLMERAPEVARELEERLDATMTAMGVMKKTADDGVMAYDQMIGEGNDEGNAIVQAAIDGLLAQTRSIERAVAALGLGGVEFEGSDSLDNPGGVFQ